MTSWREYRSGIYGIQCAVNGRWYVGQSSNITKRNTDEKRQLNEGTFHNKHLQNAWRKYGAEAFKWIVLERCPVAELDKREIEWIKTLDSFANGFNLTAGGGGARGFKHSHEWRKRASERNSNGRSPRLGKPISAEAKKRMREKALGSNSPKARAVVQITKEGQQVGVYGSIADAGRALRINPGHISAVCLGRPKRKTAGGFVWRYKEAVT